MNTSKTLLAILVEELPKQGGWPEGALNVTQDNDGEVSFSDMGTPEFGHAAWHHSSGGSWSNHDSWFYCETATDHTTAIITRDQYEAALATKGIHKVDVRCQVVDADGWITWAGGNLPVEHSALVDLKFRDFVSEFGQTAGSYYWLHTNSSADIVAYRLHTDQQVEQPTAEQEPASNTDGWIDWAGGACPVAEGTLVDVRYRDGQELNALPANDLAKSARDASYAFWRNDGNQNDIIAYRLHQPQDANSRANDDRLAQHAAAHAGFASTSRDEETDLNDCIGQAPGAPQWDGQGLPPVGVEFNYGSHRSRAKCLAVGLHYVFASKGNPDDEEGDYEELMIDAQTEFHPVHEDSDQMMRDIMKYSRVGADAAVQIANQLIAAGYRKQ